MPVKKPILAPLLISSLITLAPLAQAKPVTVAFTGFVDYMSNSSLSVPGTSIDVGDTFSGRLTYDSNVTFNPGQTMTYLLGDLYFFEGSFVSIDIMFHGANGSTKLSYAGNSGINLYDDHCCEDDNLYLTLNENRTIARPANMAGWDISFFNTGIRLGGDPDVFDFSQMPPAIPESFDWDGERRATTQLDILYSHPEFGDYYVYSQFTSFTTVSEVPIPPAALLFGSAVIGLSALKRKSRQKL